MKTPSLLIMGIVLTTLVACQPNQAKSPTSLENSVSTTADTPAASTVSDWQQYRPYSSAAFAAAADQRRVLFFHASWCPTCKALDSELQNTTAQLPSNVVIFKTDYDREKELKQKYGVTYQHTLVEVDAQGNEVKKWNGGDVSELIRQLETGAN